MYAYLYKCHILNKVNLMLIQVQQDMEKKLYKIVIPREIHGDLICTCTVTTRPISSIAEANRKPT